MLPRFLRPSHRRYKDDTNLFASWLVNIARENGLDPVLVSADDSGATTQKNGRRKSKAKSKGNKREPTYLTTAGELLRLGQSIADSAIPVPASILAVGKRAIQLRKQVTSHFLGSGDIASNKRHYHFVMVLERIYELLENHVPEADANKNPKKQPTPPSAHTKDANAKEWVNMFSVLTVDDPEDPQEPADIPQAAADAIRVEVVENGDTTEDGASICPSDLFEMICLFYDLQSYRTFIWQTWNEYRDLKIDLMTASIVTDNALQLAQDLIQDVTNSFSCNMEIQGLGIQNFLYALVCNAHVVDDNPTPKLPFSIKVADLTEFAEWLYLPTASMLLTFSTVSKDEKQVQRYKERLQREQVRGQASCSTYHSNPDPETMSAVKICKEDAKIVIGLVSECCLIGLYNAPLPVWDEITTGFVQLTRDRQPTLWQSFAAQVLLDIHHIMKSSRLGAFGDLRMSALRISRTIDDYWELSRTHAKHPRWPKDGDAAISNVRRCIKGFIETDFVLPLRQNAGTASCRPAHYLFSQNPVLCGLVMTHLNFRMQQIGQILVNSWYDVQELAFLYNMVEKTAGSKLVWPDMEMFLKIHGEGHIFIGDRPKDALQSLNRLQLAMGISSVTQFSRDSRQHKNWHARFFGKKGGKPRVIGLPTKVANLFRDRYVPVTGNNNRRNPRVIHSPDMEKLLDELLGEVNRAKGNPMSDQNGGPSLYSEPQHGLGRKWSSNHNIGPLQLLALIKGKLCEEEPMILFDYFGMHRRSMEMLRLIKAKEHDTFVNHFSSYYLPDDCWISNIVNLVHVIALDTPQTTASMCSGAEGDQISTCRTVTSCAEVMRDYLEKNGDAVCRDLRIFCKNKSHLKAMEEDTSAHLKAMEEDTSERKK